MVHLSETDIQQLDDSDLRVLVEKLSRAELLRHGMPVSGVTAGGNQTAPDGGIDVRVEAPPTATLDFIKRPVTGFQVKCSDMPPAQIHKEMKTSGQLKPSIQAILNAGGAYIIVCSQGSISDGSLQRRRAAMTDAASGMTIPSNAALDFYDAKRLADWVMLYPGVEHWVRSRIGKPLEGWKTHGTWTPHADNEAYCSDNTPRVFNRTSSSNTPQTVLDALNTMVGILTNPGGVVRLVGLSGTGKTRLTEALFDASVLDHALDAAQVLYTDQGSAPNPTAKEMLSDLGRSQRRAVVVVDNCPPQTHADLVQIVQQFPSHLSLLTVEFDVATKDDTPEATEVFELLPSSLDVLSNVLARHAPHVAQPDRHRIAELADGNARVALALVRTLAKGDTLGTLDDSAVFDRLFHQGHAEDQTLLQAARVCSLVYSFDVETEGETSHVNALARLAGLGPPQLFDLVGTLKDRDLVQSRSKWRAVLPHALANRLAKQALQRLQPGRIEEVFSSDVHLLKSFGRRLSYLHNSAEAVQLAKRWFQDPNWLGNPAKLTPLGMSLFCNLAAVTPGEALAALVSASQGPEGSSFLSTGPYQSEWHGLLRHLAYDEACFEKAALLLHAVCIQSNDRSRLDSWLELFGLVLSGTEATVEQRLTVLQRLMKSSNDITRQHAAEALGVMLKTDRFHSHHDFRFGSRPARMGWEPETVAEQTHWYATVFEGVSRLACQDENTRRLLQPHVAKRLGSLLRHVPNVQQLPSLVKSLTDVDGWPEAWVALNRDLRKHEEPVTPDRQAALQTIRQLIAPGNLAQQIRAHVLVDRWTLLEATETREEIESGSQEPHRRLIDAVHALGQEVVIELSILPHLLPELMTGTTQGLQKEFAEALAKALSRNQLESVWEQMVQTFSDAAHTARNDWMLQGFLAGAAITCPEWASRILDASIAHPVLSLVFPALQHWHLDDRCVDRLHQWIDRGDAHIHAMGLFSRTLFEDPRWGPAAVQAIYMQVAQKPQGHRVAVDALAHLLMLYPKDAVAHRELLELGASLLSDLHLDERAQNSAFRVTTIAKKCLLQQETSALAQRLCQELVNAGEHSSQILWDYCELVEILLASQPEVALPAFLYASESSLGRTLLSGMSIHSDKQNPINAVPLETLKLWVGEDPSTRAPLVAKEVRLTKDVAEGSHGLSDIAEFLLQVSDTSDPVLQGFEYHFHPTLYVGSVAQMLNPYLALTRRLSHSTNPKLAQWAVHHTEDLQRRIENDWLASRTPDERFE